MSAEGASDDKLYFFFRERSIERRRALLCLRPHWADLPVRSPFAAPSLPRPGLALVSPAGGVLGGERADLTQRLPPE